ncbi:NifU family protein [Sphaerisporangium corydalis]|uniref:NifU family protein n=1 Tax=Sphaerisporangium corydalis TaxID=1441875 RepID=A0ABV9EAH3_9ACTN|nr:NifU family protein [Sphaerisporangium corydalis]
MPSTRREPPGAPGRPVRGAADIRAAGDRVETLIEELGALADPAARAKAEELVRGLVDLYGAGLERIMRIVVENEAGEVLRDLTGDEAVSGLLVLHDLHPLSTEERVSAALDGVRPFLGLHEGGVELLGVHDGVVRLRLQGSCDGCASSLATVTGSIERAVRQAAPEVTLVQVDGVAEASSPLLQIRTRPPGPCPVPEEAAP